MINVISVSHVPSGLGSTGYRRPECRLEVIYALWIVFSWLLTLKAPPKAG